MPARGTSCRAPGSPCTARESRPAACSRCGHCAGWGSSSLDSARSPCSYLPTVWSCSLSDSEVCTLPSVRTSSGATAANSTSDELDRLIHERIRLGIVSALAANDSLTFAELRDILKTTDGNLSVHARKLEEAGYVRVTKGFEDRRPKTEYRLTPRGRRALEAYLLQMEGLLSVARDALERT
ncbi:MAG: transcriptional regulator [Gemmatimonadetes bacterium]|nr:transcriptional regulator [Gemmatimonadota bacterium]